MTLPNITQALWWQQPKPALPLAPTLPTVTPAQVVTSALAANTIATQGELLDACKAKGLAINYSGLQVVLRTLQQSGVIASRFATVDTALPCLVYQRRH